MLLKIVQLNWNLFEVFWVSGGFWERDTLRIFNFPSTLFMCCVYTCMTTTGSRLFFSQYVFSGDLGGQPWQHVSFPTKSFVLGVHYT